MRAPSQPHAAIFGSSHFRGAGLQVRSFHQACHRRPPRRSATHLPCFCARLQLPLASGVMCCLHFAFPFRTTVYCLLCMPPHRQQHMHPDCAPATPSSTPSPVIGPVFSLRAPIRNLLATLLHPPALQHASVVLHPTDNLSSVRLACVAAPSRRRTRLHVLPAGQRAVKPDVPCLQFDMHGLTRASVHSRSGVGLPRTMLV